MNTPDDGDTRPSRDDPALIAEARRQAERASGNDTLTLHIAEAKEPLPERIGPYRVQGRLGRGGMGTVLLAVQEDPQFKRHVAIKLLRKGLDTADILRRFGLERQVLAALNHPNIARLLDAGQTPEGLPYFVMEHVEGQALDDYCDAQNLTVDDRLELFRKVCSAVHYAHQNLVVHRDLKPGNILVTANGEPKLLDFGIAKLLNPGLMQVSVMTGPELRLMTPEYASPEQVRGEPIGITSDVYALGVLLYELLSGHRPYRLPTRIQHEVVRVVCDTDPELPSNAVGRTEDHVRRDGTTVHVTPESVARVRGGAPARLRRRLMGDLDNIVLKAMQKVPRRRYASAEQLGEDIQRHLDGMPIIARPDSRIYRFQKFVRRNRLGVTAAAVVFLALALGIAGTTWQWRVAAHERDRANAFWAEALGAKAEIQKSSDRFTQLYEFTNKELQRELDKLEGATAARRQLGRTAVQTAQILVDAGHNDPNMIRQLAEMTLLSADALGSFRSGNQGETDAALAEYQRSIDLLQRLVAAQPDDPSLRLRLIRARTRQADTVGRVGRLSDALVLYQRVAAEAEELAQRTEQKAAFQAYWAMALDGAGDQQFALGRREDARTSYQAARAIKTTVATENPNSGEAQRALTVSEGKLAKLLEDEGKLEEALRERHATLATRERAYSADKNVETRRDLMFAREKVGDLLRLLERFDEAEPEVQVAWQEACALADLDPADVRAAVGLARIELGMAALRRDQGRFDEAQTIASSAMERAERLLSVGTPDADRKYLFARAREAFAQALHGLAPSRAIAAYGDALQAYAEIPGSGEEHKVIKMHQGAVSIALGLALADAGQSAPAKVQLQTALAQLAALGPDENLTYEVRLEVGRARARLEELRRGDH